jgi:hypothetical protein
MYIFTGPFYLYFPSILNPSYLYLFIFLSLLSFYSKPFLSLYHFLFPSLLSFYFNLFFFTFMLLLSFVFPYEPTLSFIVPFMPTLSFLPPSFLFFLFHLLPPSSFTSYQRNRLELLPGIIGRNERRNRVEPRRAGDWRHRRINFRFRRKKLCH